MKGPVGGAWRWYFSGSLAAVSGCAGEQSALAPAGREAVTPAVIPTAAGVQRHYYFTSKRHAGHVAWHAERL